MNIESDYMKDQLTNLYDVIDKRDKTIAEKDALLLRFMNIWMDYGTKGDKKIPLLDDLAEEIKQNLWGE